METEQLGHAPVSRAKSRRSVRAKSGIRKRFRYGLSSKFPNVFRLTLIDILAATQTAASQRVLMKALDFKKEEETGDIERALTGIAFSSHPSHGVVNDLKVMTLYCFTFGSTSLYLFCSKIKNIMKPITKPRTIRINLSVAVVENTSNPS